MSQRSLAIAALIFVMVVWGSTFVVTKAAATEIPPLTLAFLRFLIASAVLVPLALARGGLKRLPQPVPWGVLTAMAVTGIALFTIGFNYGLVYASATQGALIYAISPAAIAFAAVVFLNERPTARRIAGIVLSIVGVTFVIAGAERSGVAPQPLLGAFWMLLAIVGWTVYMVLAKRLAAADQLVVITCVSVIGTAILLPPAAVELLGSELPQPSLQAWLGLLFLGIIASSLAYVVFNYTLRALDASLVGVFTNLDPIIGIITAVLLLGESLHMGQMLGGVIAFAGMWLAAATSAESSRG